MGQFFDPRAEVDVTQQNLPHWQQGEVWGFVTWRLADSVPQRKLRDWKEEVAAWRRYHPEPWDVATWEEYRELFSRPFDAWLDQGLGSCLLRAPANRQILVDSFHHFDGDRHRVGNYVIMPNHVHVLFSILGTRKLPEIVQSWKRHTSRLINAREGLTGKKLWQPDYYDRLIRSELHLRRVIEYIEGNPRGLAEGTYTLWGSGSPG